MENFLIDDNSIGRFKIFHSSNAAMTIPKISESKKGGTITRSCVTTNNKKATIAIIKNKITHRSNAVHSNHSNFFRNDTGCHLIKLNKCKPFKLTVTINDVNNEVTNRCMTKTPFFDSV